MSWDGAATSPGLTADDIRRAIEKVRDASYEPQTVFPVHPETYRTAQRLLGVSEDTPLTDADMWEAARIERDAMTDEQRAQLDHDLAALYAHHAHY